MAGADGDAQHIAEHCDADLRPDPGQEPDQHRARKEIGQKAGLEDAREQKQARLSPASACRPAPCTGRRRPAPSWESAPEKIAAVAESAATTRWRDEPKTAKAMRGRRTV